MIDPDLLTRQDVTDKFALNVWHGGWSNAQGDAALKLMVGLYRGKINLDAMRLGKGISPNSVLRLWSSHDVLRADRLRREMCVLKRMST